MIALEGIGKGDRIVFRAATRDSNRELDRNVIDTMPARSEHDRDYMVVRAHGWSRLMVRLDEISEHYRLNG